MANSGDILEQFLQRLITSPAQQVTITGLVSVFDALIVNKQCLPNIDIPYDDITSFIYGFDQEINLEDLDTMMELLESAYIIRYPLDPTTGKKHENHRCLSKFRKHIFLAATQKQYVAQIAQDLARTANQVAQEAKEQAETAKKMYNEMMVNYITILGIFASIIITIFGGMQVISATTGLLQANISLATLILVLSFLAILIILILAILLNWISNLKESKRSNKFVYIALSVTISAMIGAGIYMFCYKKTNPATQNSKVLIKEQSK